MKTVETHALKIFVTYHQLACPITMLTLHIVLGVFYQIWNLDLQYSMDLKMPHIPGLIKTPGGNFINGLRLRIGILLRFESIERDSDFLAGIAAFS